MLRKGGQPRCQSRKPTTLTWMVDVPILMSQFGGSAQSTVNRRPHSQLVSVHAGLARLLSLLLLSFIFYGTTIRAVHQHGNPVLPVESASRASISEKGSETTINTTLGGCNDCLTCQLHQQFSATLTSSPPSVDRTISNSLFSTLALVSAGSRTTAPTIGRAPPSVS